ncbi:Uncharacterised protein [Klebsiella pneumoniae]|nr:Uncharacterised protein [Klebsiella pneumoniae]
MSSILSTEVPALYSTGEALTFRCTSNVNFLNVSENFNADVLANSELFTF